MIILLACDFLSTEMRSMRWNVSRNLAALWFSVCVANGLGWLQLEKYGLVLIGDRSLNLNYIASCSEVQLFETLVLVWTTQVTVFSDAQWMD